MSEIVQIPVEEYKLDKKKAELVDDALFQMKMSLEDLKAGRVKHVA